MKYLKGFALLAIILFILRYTEHYDLICFICGTTFGIITQYIEE